MWITQMLVDWWNSVLATFIFSSTFLDSIDVFGVVGAVPSNFPWDLFCRQEQEASTDSIISAMGKLKHHY